MIWFLVGVAIATGAWMLCAPYMTTQDLNNTREALLVEIKRLSDRLDAIDSRVDGVKARVKDREEFTIGQKHTNAAIPSKDTDATVRRLERMLTQVEGSLKDVEFLREKTALVMEKYDQLQEGILTFHAKTTKDIEAVSKRVDALTVRVAPFIQAVNVRVTLNESGEAVSKKEET